jgi:two-component system osmolarity sensor histidine kinase EnvZ
MWARLKAWLRRRDGLFTRMLLIQTALVVGVSLIYFSLYFIERNRTVATLLADQWAEGLAAAAGHPLASARQANQVLVSQGMPQQARLFAGAAPRMQALKQRLAGYGIEVNEVALDKNHQPSVLWLHVNGGAHGPLWLGVSGPIFEEHEARRLLLGLMLATALVIALSWNPARRMTRRLERLRLRIRSGAILPPEPPDLASTPEIIEIEQAYDALVTQVHQQQSERTLLLAGVSHDLRSPLSRIRMAAELLPDDASLAPRKATIVANVQAADRLIESFMDLVRSSELPLNEPVDVAHVARSVAALFEVGAGQLQVETPDVLELPHANQHLIERAVFNLLDNAFKHGAPPVKLCVVERAGDLRIAVQDSGSGMPGAEPQAMLKAFARGDASRGKAGSGLGLAVVHQVAARLGGRVRFEGGAGQWRVVLQLPLRQAPNELAHGRTPSPAC